MTYKEILQEALKEQDPTGVLFLKESVIVVNGKITYKLTFGSCEEDETVVHIFLHDHQVIGGLDEVEDYHKEKAYKILVMEYLTSQIYNKLTLAADIRNEKRNKG